MQIRKFTLDQINQGCSTIDCEVHETARQSLRVSTTVEIEGISYLVEAVPSVGLVFLYHCARSVAEKLIASPRSYLFT